MAASDDAAGATRHDDETLDYVKLAVGREHGLSEGHARRLRGSTVSALRDDAKQMRDELGLEPLDEHDDRGRHRDQGGSVRAWRARHELDHPSSERSIVNDEIRRAAGRRVEPVIADPPHAGDVGIGRGAGSAPQPVHDDVVVTFNKQIRLSAGVVRGRYPVDLIASL